MGVTLALTEGSEENFEQKEKWGPRNTRKDAKGKRAVNWEAHVTTRDPTLDAVGTRSHKHIPNI